MSSITIHARLRAKPGREREFEAWAAEVVGKVREGEPGTQVFGFYRSDTPGDYIVFEKYSDAAAVAAHMDNIGHLLGRMPDLVVESGEPLSVCGEVSDELRQLYLSWNPVFLPTVAAI